KSDFVCRHGVLIGTIRKARCAPFRAAAHASFGKAATMHRRKVPARLPSPVLVGMSVPAAGLRLAPAGACSRRLFLTTNRAAARFAPLVRRPRRSATTFPPA